MLWFHRKKTGNNYLVANIILLLGRSAWTYYSWVLEQKSHGGFVLFATFARILHKSVPEKGCINARRSCCYRRGSPKNGYGLFFERFLSSKDPRAVTKITRVDGYPCPTASESGPGEIFCAEQRRNAQKVQKHRGEHRQSIL